MFLGLLMRKFGKVSVRLSFSTTRMLEGSCRKTAENAVKSSVFMYQEAMSIFLGSKNVLNFVYFRVEYIFGV